MDANTTKTVKHMTVVGFTLAIISLIFITLIMMLFPFLNIIIDSVILSIFLYPFYVAVENRLHGHKSIAASLTLLFFLVGMLLPVMFIINSLVREVSYAATQLPKEFISISTVEVFINRTLRTYNLPVKEIQPELNQYIVNIIRTVYEYLAGILSRTGTIIVHIFLILLTTFYLLVEKKRILQFTEDILPLSKTHYERLRNRINDVVVASIKGFLAVIILQSLLAMTGLLIFGISAPTLLGIIYGLSSMVPVVGNAIVWIPIVLYLYITKGLFFAAGLTLWVLLGNFLIDHLVTPNIIGRATGIHSLIILFGVLGGLHVFGFPGIIIGPTIISLAFIELEFYKELVK